MLKRLADNRNRNSLASVLRRRRAAFFSRLLDSLEGPVKILDVGGTEAYWTLTGLAENDKIRVTLLNLKEPAVTLPRFSSARGDARKLEFMDSSFDVVFSNSVIEHVGAFEDQANMASECGRVGKRFFIQTPNKYFPIEPHFLFPFFQFLPIPFRVWLLRNFRLGWFPKTPDTSRATQIVEGIRLLDRRELTELFPSGRIFEEKFLGLTKSFVAYGGWG
jgi:SAM-dependent methyltransferase